MKKTVISAAFVGLSLGAKKGFRGYEGEVNHFYDNQLGFKKDMDKAGHWYSEHSGDVDSAITTAAKVGKILADQNDNEFGVEQRAEWVAKHAGTIGKIASMFGDENDDQLGFRSDMDKAGHWYSDHSGAVDSAVTTAAQVGKILADENDDEFGVKQRAEFVAKHGKTIARIASMLGDENDDEFGIKQRAEFVAKHGKTIARIASMFGDENDDQLGFKSDMDKAGHWYSDHSGAVDSAVTTAAQVGKILADENDDEFGIKQRAEFVAKHGKTIARIASMFGDENDDQLGFKSDMEKAGHFYEDHSGAIDSAITTAAQVGKIIAGDENDNQFGQVAKKAWHFFRYGP